MASRHQPEVNYPMNLVDEAVSFDVEQFDNLIRNQGITFVHWRAMACPLGMVDPDDERHPHEEHPTCSNGFIYTLAGKVTCGFVSNSVSSRMADVGKVDGSVAQIVIPRYYDRENDQQPLVRVEMLKFDRLYLDEAIESQITVPTWERIATAAAGVDKTEFPIVSVTDVLDAQGQRYKQGDDFTITADGDINWTGRRPAFDLQHNRGTVYSIRYRYRPHWYVDHLIHEVRVAPVADLVTGLRGMTQMPQNAEIHREYFFRKDQRNPGGPPNPRTSPAPAPAPMTGGVPMGGFGPREL